MRSALFVFALGGMSTFSCATNLPTHHHQVSRQSGVCLPVFLEYPTSSDVPCGGNQEYVMAVCSCCPAGASGTIGCDAAHVCSTDAYGNTICCPEGEPDCGQASSPASPTTDSSDSSSSDPTSTVQQPITTSSYDSSSSDPTSAVQQPVTTSSSGQSNTGTASGSSSSAQSSSGDASTYDTFLWQPLVLVVALLLA